MTLGNTPKAGVRDGSRPLGSATRLPVPSLARALLAWGAATALAGCVELSQTVTILADGRVEVTATIRRLALEAITPPPDWTVALNGRTYGRLVADPSGENIVAWGERGEVTLLSLDAKKILWTSSFPKRIAQLEPGPKGRVAVIAVGGDLWLRDGDGVGREWRRLSSRRAPFGLLAWYIRWQHGEPRGNFHKVAFSADGTVLVAQTDLQELLVWDLGGGGAPELVRQVDLTVTLDTDPGRWALVGTGPGTMVWAAGDQIHWAQADDLAAVGRLRLPAPVKILDASPSGHWFATDGKVVYGGMARSPETWVWSPGEGDIAHLWSAPQGVFVVGLRSGRLVVFREGRSEPSLDVDYGAWRTWTASVDAGGRFLMRCSPDLAFTLWEIDTGKEMTVPYAEDVTGDCAMDGEGRILELGNLFGPSPVWIVGGKAPPLPMPLDGEGLPLLVGGKGLRSVLVGLDGGTVTAWRLATLEAAYAAPIWDQLPAEHFRPASGQHAFVGRLGSLPMKMAWRSWSECASETASVSWWERLFPDPDRDPSPPELRNRREGIYCLVTYSWTFDSVAEYNARFERWYRGWNPGHRWSDMGYGAKKGVRGVLLGLLTIERDGPAGELVLEMNPVAARDYAVALRECRDGEPWCEEFLEFPVSLTVRREGAGSPLAPGAAVEGDSATWRFTLAEWMATSARAVWPTGPG